MDPLIGLAMCGEFVKWLFHGSISALIAFVSWPRESSKP